MRYWVFVDNKPQEVVIHLWRNPIRWWRQFREFAPANVTTTWAKPEDSKQ